MLKVDERRGMGLPGGNGDDFMRALLVWKISK